MVAANLLVALAADAPFDSRESTSGLTFAQGRQVREGKTVGGIAYDVQGSGPVVVLLSGSNLDRRMWAHETAWLAKTHTVVRYDLRAHGQSDTAASPFSHFGDLIGFLTFCKVVASRRGRNETT